MNKWNKQIEWIKKSDYIVRCLEETFAPNNAGNPMFTLKLEVAWPNTVVLPDGEEIIVAGIPLTTWCVVTSLTGTKNASPEEATANCHRRYLELRKTFELPYTTESEIDWNNPPGGFKGKLVYALIEDKEDAERGAPSKEDLAKGIKVGPILLNPKTKLPLKVHYPEIKDFYGIAELPSNQAF